MSDDNIVPFGKYKGQPIERLAQDHAYCEWLVGQDWFRTRFTAIHTLIINHFGESEETPEHNALQARFTDMAWAARFMIAAAGGWVHILQIRAQAANEGLFSATRDVERVAKDVERGVLSKDYLQHLHAKAETERTNRDQLVNAPLKVCVDRPEFEVKGVDVVVQGYIEPCGTLRTRYVQCKPAMGDEYPAVLRQMRATGCNVLFIGTTYTGVGATLEQVRTIFKSAKMQIIFLSDVPDRQGD